jgi:hypothetical protein
MKQWLTLAAMLAGAVLLIPLAQAQDGKTPTIKDIMKKLNYRDTALCPTLGKSLRADPPNWDDVQKDARTCLNCVELLARLDPPKGDRGSWQKFSQAYLMAARELDSAAQRKDRPAAQAAHQKLANPAMCNGCHNIHRN